MLTQVTARTQVIAATFCSRAQGQAMVCFLADLSAHMSLLSMTKYLQMLTLLESHGHLCGQASLWGLVRTRGRSEVTPLPLSHCQGRAGLRLRPSS